MRNPNPSSSSQRPQVMKHLTRERQIVEVKSDRCSEPAAHRKTFSSGLAVGCNEPNECVGLEWN